MAIEGALNYSALLEGRVNFSKGEKGDTGADGYGLLPFGEVTSRLGMDGIPASYTVNLGSEYEELPPRWMLSVMLAYGTGENTQLIIRGKNVLFSESIGWCGAEAGQALFTYDGNMLGYVVGAKGEQGESITITSIEESTEDGGANAVTFSDGNVLHVKNGGKGDKGDTGATGGAILPTGTCAGDSASTNSNTTSPSVAELTEGMLFLQTFTTDVKKVAGFTYTLTVSIEGSSHGYPTMLRWSGEDDLRAGTYLLRWSGNTYMDVIGHIAESVPTTQEVVDAVLDALPTWSGGAY